MSCFEVSLKVCEKSFAPELRWSRRIRQVLQPGGTAVPRAASDDAKRNTERRAATGRCLWTPPRQILWCL